MAYQCPRCGDEVHRGSSTTAGAMGGLAGMLLYAVISPFHCVKCGPIPGSEFPASVRMEALAGSLAMLGVAALLIVGVIYLLGYFG